MNFKDAESYLYSLGNEVGAMKLGLKNIRKLLAALNNPQNNYKKVQVAGTNGKGSVCAFLNAICVEAGIGTGLYTSPHLISITERVRINGKDIPESEFARFAVMVRQASERLLAEGEVKSLPTFFEQVTAMAFLAFAESGVKLAILETGIGGRLDATTAADAEIAAITRIDIDHQQYLGERLRDIALEKAAIIRPETRVIVGLQDGDVLDVILENCKSKGVQPRLAAEVRITQENGNRLIKTGKADYLLPYLGLAGEHQIENAVTAILLAEELQCSFYISLADIVHGLEKVRHPGRLEYIGKYLLDGAHNAAGAKVLRRYLDEFIPQDITLIFGAMRDKDISMMSRLLFPRAKKLILTQPANPRAADISDLKSHLGGRESGNSIFEEPLVARALTKAAEITGDEEIILVAGSLYLVGEARKILTSAKH